MLRYGGSVKLGFDMVPVVVPFVRFQLARHVNTEVGTITQGAQTLTAELEAAGLMYDFLLGFDYDIFTPLSLFVEGGYTTGSIDIDVKSASVSGTPISIAGTMGSISGFRVGGGVVVKF